MKVETRAIAENIAHLRDRIERAAERSGRRPEDVTLVAISKTFPVESIRAAYQAGIRHFGENKVQEYELKQAQTTELDAKWHFVGHLQSNKARRAVHLFDRVDSLDSLGLARKLDAAAADEGKRLPVLIEVRLGDESTKSGAGESELQALAESVLALPHMEMLGLMVVPPYFDESEKVRPFFAKLRALRDGLRTSLRQTFPVLSMGMSHDYEIAIGEGATEVRVGTAVFGDRGYAAD